MFILGQVFYSGTFEALVYDSLAEDNRCERYPHTLAGITALRWASLALTCAAGGYLYGWNPSAPYLATGLTFAVGLLITCFRVSPRRRRGLSTRDAFFTRP